MFSSNVRARPSSWRKTYNSPSFGIGGYAPFIRIKWREYLGSHLFAAKIPGTLAEIKHRNVRPIAIGNRLTTPYGQKV